MSKVSFVQDGALVVAPANYGLVDSSIGGQLARKQLCKYGVKADARTKKGMKMINDCRQGLVNALKDPAATLRGLAAVGVNRIVLG